jgi:cellulose synthase/poly-beta-1,6-N-acetylglucosamine synthase-like glycosyltransferase
MIGTSLEHNNSVFVTHTSLPKEQSALETVSKGQKRWLFFAAILIVGIFVLFPVEILIGIVAFLSFIYFMDMIFNLFLINKSLNASPEIVIQPQEIAKLSDEELPTYTILCPLYKEANVLSQFVYAISNLDWPKDKLEVLMLFEEDDKETIKAAAEMELPSFVKVIIVPASEPKTKPKACNYGLGMATGEYLVIYDAEDMPEADQLKKAYLAFQQLPANVVCLQAKLNFFNPEQNMLTRLFTAEYSLWFDLILPGLQSIEAYIPLGGTSNHFRTKDLMMLQGWDPFNVTEDCDLGARIFHLGFQTAIIDSTTYEEANSDLGNWLRQRSRWIKGYMQTYLVHMRKPINLLQRLGFDAFIFQMVVGFRVLFLVINPILWLMTIAYFGLNSLLGPKIEALYPDPILYIAVSTLIFGNFLYLYYYMVGCARRKQWHLIKYVYMVPIYWFFGSVSAVIAFYQLIIKPHYWEKTNHGLAMHNKFPSLSSESNL